MGKVFCIVLIVLVSSLCFSVVAGRTWYIKPDGAGDAPTIQAGIDSAAVGDTVLLANGTYTGTGNRDIDYYGKAITVRSESGNPDACIINCEGAGRGFYFHSGEGSGSVIEGVTITGGSADPGGGVYCASSSPTIQDCVFIGNSSNDGSGIFCGSSSPTISHCTFYGNSTVLTGTGVIFIVGGSPILQNTIIAFNSHAVFHCGGGQGDPVLTCCNLYGNPGGDGTGNCFNAVWQYGNISEDPQFCDPESGNLYLSYDSPCLFGECGQIGAFGLGCVGARPRITSVVDVPDDQGHQVRIRWLHSSYDAPDETVDITGYGVYRREISAFPTGEKVAGLSSGDPPNTRSPQLFGWDYIATIPSRGDSVYQFVAPTLCDSTAAQGICWSAFFVSAMTPEPLVHYDSPVDSGYAVDNLVPHMPTGFFGVGIIEGSPTGLKLSWDANRDPDISHYSLYKGITEDFVPGETNYLGAAVGNSYFDESWTLLDHHYYKLAAEDIHGNASIYAVLGPAEIVIGVLLQSYSASYTGSAIEVTWTLVSPLEQSTQHIMRSSDQEEVFTEISNPFIIQDNLTFTFRDEAIESGTMYKYRVEVEGKVGQRMLLFKTENIATPTLPITLYQNIPNPFNPSTVIRYYLPEKCPVTLEVFNSSGKLISRLLNDEVKEKGMNSVEWRGTDDHGRSVASGVYFCRLIAGKETISRKMILLK